MRKLGKARMLRLMIGDDHVYVGAHDAEGVDRQVVSFGCERIGVTHERDRFGTRHEEETAVPRAPLDVNCITAINRAR